MGLEPFLGPQRVSLGRSQLIKHITSYTTQKDSWHSPESFTC